MSVRTLRLAVVQMTSDNGRREANLARAAGHVVVAAAQGAELVLLPELFATGFDLGACPLDLAETQDGPLERWLAQTARHAGLFVGGSFLERRGNDLFDTFTLAGPSGIVGRVRKRTPCAFEAYVFSAGDDRPVIDTPLGRIGVAIGHDGTRRAVWDRLLAEAPDVVLMPLSAPAPMPRPFYGQARSEAFLAPFRTGASACAALFGLPCALSNKWGPWESALPGSFPPRLFGRQRSVFPGFSHIADGDGRDVARVEDGQGVAVATVHLDPARRLTAVPQACPGFDPWIFEPPPEYKLFPVIEAFGRRWYRKNVGASLS